MASGALSQIARIARDSWDAPGFAQDTEMPQDAPGYPRTTQGYPRISPLFAECSMWEHVTWESN